MDTFFVLDHPSIRTIEEATVAEAIEQENWKLFSLDEKHLLCCPDVDMLDDIIRQHGIQQVVPIGSVEFVTRFCQDHQIDVPEAINIPRELEEERFLQRKIWRDMSTADLAKLPADKPYLLKPGRTIKLFETALYQPGHHILKMLPPDEPLFILEYIPTPFQSEWRLFVRRGEILDLRPYYMKNWSMPDETLCREMAQKLKDYQAITLDVAVLASGDTVVIEVHTFLACGFYGCEGPTILTMSKLAWKELCQKSLQASGPLGQAKE